MTVAKSHRVCWLGIVLSAFILASDVGSSAGAQFGMFKRDKTTKYQVFKDAAGRFTLEYPANDWRVIPGGGSVLIGFTQKDGEVSVLVDYTKLKLTLAPSEIDSSFAELEVQTLKERQPNAKDIKSNLVAGPRGPRVVIQFSRSGEKGAEQVFQYSIPNGDDLFRLVCTVRSDRTEKNQPILSHMVESFATSR